MKPLLCLLFAITLQAATEGNVIHHTLYRLAAFVDATVGKRLTYERLIAPVEVKA